MDYEEADKNALMKSLLAWHVCPRCRSDLRPVAGVPDTWGCAGYGYGQHAPETWYVPEEDAR
jgi:hypothetical protein